MGIVWILEQGCWILDWEEVIKNYEKPVYQKYDYLIAAHTFIFNSLSQDQKPANSAGHKLLDNGPEKLDPTLVKSIIMEETKMGTYKGMAPNDGTQDIMQANVWFSEKSNDWNDFKLNMGLKKGEGASPTQSVHLGIRILYMKGLKSESIKNSKGRVTGYQVSWRDKEGSWWEAVKRYNGGGNPNYLKEVKDFYDNSAYAKPENYIENTDKTPKAPTK